jgi:hypothetical protein
MWKVCSVVMLAALFGSAESASAKRSAPKPVAPVVYGGITYSAPNHGRSGNYVVASDSTGKEQFRIKVFDTPIDRKLEEDVQWVFITELKLAGRSLIVKDEKSRCYTVDLETKTVKQKC